MKRLKMIVSLLLVVIMALSLVTFAFAEGEEETEKKTEETNEEVKKEEKEEEKEEAPVVPIVTVPGPGVYTVTLHHDNSTVDSTIYSNGTGYYLDDTCTSTLSAVSVPTKPGFSFKGYYNSGTQYFSATGAPAAYPSASIELTASWEAASTYTITLNHNNSTANGALYAKAGVSALYSDSACTTAVTKVTVPVKTGYIFNGYYNGNVKIINADGTINATTFSAATTLTADWTLRTFVVNSCINSGYYHGAVSYTVSYADGSYYSSGYLTATNQSIVVPYGGSVYYTCTPENLYYVYVKADYSAVGYGTKNNTFYYTLPKVVANHTVEVRFYYYTNPATGEISPWIYGAGMLISAAAVYFILRKRKTAK